ncbi:hypothetical protein FORC88_3393 [Salmonella enterica subsp. enterica serovar Typhimurium]|nr:hypothetical protein FORC88_3393 [Salmonella enterica subsp. enterica serovar Typhimurium]
MPDGAGAYPAYKQYSPVGRIRRFASLSGNQMSVIRTPATGSYGG